MRRALATAAACALASVAMIGGPALAADGEPTPAVVGSAQVRVAHFSPDAPGVDVYVDGVPALSNVTYNTTTDYQSVPAGSHEITLRVAGSDATAKPVVESEADLVADQAYTIAGVGPAAKLRTAVFEDDWSSPPTGSAKLRVIHAAPGTETVDVQAVGGPLLASDVAFAEAAPYTVLPPGHYGIAVDDADDGARLLAVPDVDLASGIVYSVVVIGGAGQPLQLLPIVDARGSEVLPAGALQTGGGGTAVAGDSMSDPWLVAGVAIGVLAAVFLVARLRRGHARTT